MDTTKYKGALTGGVGPEICIKLPSHVGASKSGRIQFSTTASFMISIVQHIYLNSSNIELLSRKMLFY